MTRFCLLVTLCSLTGLVVGGTASHAEMQQCLGSDSPTNACLTADPATKTVEGMGMGMVAGAGAAIGAVWQLRQNND
ncbi:hypothetical protein [Microcoleus sp. FACHB-1515]|uniref:hypothetical protein n=2 Tax=Cyanophyceae TaxID=3028117 RepID=UPI001F54DA2D|nr:hypothetical protein [Microcoleus sp. FACHB-1515]